MRHLTFGNRLVLTALSFTFAGCAAVSLAQEAPAEPDQAKSLYEAAPDAFWIGPLGWADAVTGGAGGEILKVTNLNNDGPGSLRDALAFDGPRTIVFEVGGVIDLKEEELRINHPKVTIAGQTAPSPGITLIRGGMIIAADDVIVQHLRIRPGDLGQAYRSGRDIDAITTIGAHRVIVDHCSLTWATDENLSASGPRFTGETVEEWRDGTSGTIAFTNNIIAEGLSHSTHAKGEHSKGSLIHDNVSDILIYGNLYAHNFERSPLFKGGVQGAIINNFIYNPGQRAIHYNLQGLEWGDVPPVDGGMAVIGNVMRAGPSTKAGLPLVLLGGDGDLHLTLRDNLAVDGWGNDLPLIGRTTTGRAKIVETQNVSIPADLRIMSPRDVERYVLKNAGARPWDRDKHDVRVLADTAEGRGEIIDSQDEVGGYPAVTPPTRRAFNPDDWDLLTMKPRRDGVLDAGASARGT
jgi:pectate lyase